MRARRTAKHKGAGQRTLTLWIMSMTLPRLQPWTLRRSIVDTSLPAGWMSEAWFLLYMAPWSHAAVETS